MRQAGPHPGVRLCDFIYVKCGLQKHIHMSQAAASVSAVCQPIFVDQRQRATPRSTLLLPVEQVWLCRAFLLELFLKCLHNRGGELEQPHALVPSLRNQIKHTVGGNDVTPLLSEPLVSLTAVWSDHRGQKKNKQ